MDKLGNFVREETYAILTLPNLSYSKTQHQVFASKSKLTFGTFRSLRPGGIE